MKKILLTNLVALLMMSSTNLFAGSGEDIVVGAMAFKHGIDDRMPTPQSENNIIPNNNADEKNVSNQEKPTANEANLKNSHILK